MSPKAVHTGWVEMEFPKPSKQTRIVPMPKLICVSGQRIRTLGMGRGSGVLTDLDTSTLAVAKQSRNLPVIHKLFLDSELNSLGYTQRFAKGNPSELHFLDPELSLVRTERLPDAGTGFAPCVRTWIVACRDGGLRCFDRCGRREWIWYAPRDRHFD